MKLSLIDKLKLLGKLNTAANAVQEGINMKDATKVIVAVVALITGILQIPSINAAIVAAITAHPAIAAGLGGLSAVLALLHNPNTQKAGDSKGSSQAGIVPMILLFILFFPASTVQAQAVTNIPLPTNVYGIGLSYNNGASPAIAGTATYSRLISQSSGTYGFTVLDMLPESFNPTVVTTNIGVGVSQKAVTVGPFNVFIPVSTGLTVTGTNSGWNWTGGGLVDYNIKKAGIPTNYHIQPNVRFVKSAVNGGSGYQLIFGALFAFGQ